MYRTRILGIASIVLAVLLLIFVVYKNYPMYQTPTAFAAKDTLTSTWSAYKNAYVDASGKTTDTTSTQGKNITTSEGQSYTMLRAVWMDDRSEFDLAWHWTQTHLERPDHLFSWLYGTQANGQGEILSQQGGQTTASDADTDIALSLVFAYARWGDPAYLAQARAIIDSIWNNDVVIIGGVPYLAADNLEKAGAGSVVVNPSYFSPYAYRIFSVVDTDHSHNWGGLVQSSYDVLNNSIWAPLNTKTSAGLPPDWILINRHTGALQASSNPALDTNYGYDAFRIPWRIALDQAWYADPRDSNFLNKLSFLDHEWSASHILFSTYSHDGKVVVHQEAPAMYGASMGYFAGTNSSFTDALYRTKLQVLYDPSAHAWKTPLSYYDDSWAWFGMALYTNQLPNLARSLVF